MMEPLTKADCIAKVREHFSRPDAQLAYDSDMHTCVYRGGEDPTSLIRCAFGVLIPDEMYELTMERKIAANLYDGVNGMTTAQSPVPLGLKPLFAPDVGPSWLNRLQSLHDQVAVAGTGTVGRFLSLLDALEKEGE